MQTDDTVVSSTTTTDVSDASSAPVDDNTVPFHQHPRFKELIEDKNASKAEVAQLKAELERLQSVFKQPEPVQEEKVPDLYDDPKAYAEYIKAQTIAEIERRQQEATSRTIAAQQAIDAQYAKIRETDPDIDEDAIGEFAIKHELFNKDGRGYNLIKAHEFMKQMNGARDQGSKETLESVKRAKIASGGGGSTKEVSGLNLSQQDLRKMSMSQLVANLAKNH